MNTRSTPAGVPAIALQLYTIRRELAEDFEGALRRVREIGFRAVETYPLPPQVTLGRASETFRALELEVVAMHEDLPSAEKLDAMTESAAAFDCRRVVWHGWPRPAEFDSASGVHTLIDSYQRAHDVSRRRGLEWGLHNHWWEFETRDGVAPYRLFHEMLDPGIFFELDVYWAQTAGMDPAAVLSELGPRVRLLHVKDGPAIQGQPMTAVGDGTLDVAGILNAARHPLAWIVELDECATGLFEALTRSFRHLKTVQETRQTQV